MTYVIAEVGSNWHNLRDCLDSIAAAKACGADAVKFQLFSYRELYGPGVAENFIEKWALDPAWLPILHEKATACGIEFMCTAFSAEGYRLVDPLVKRHKIASSDFNHVPLVRFVRSFGKTIIASCGGMSWQDIEIMVRDEYAQHEPGCVLLYCNAAYPSYGHNFADLDRIKKLTDGHSNLSVGFSDHSKDVCEAPVGAFKRFGAVVIEKHFRLDRIQETPDSAHSLDEEDFKRMTDAIRYKKISYGTKEEDEFRIRDTRRARAIKAIKRGERLRYNTHYAYFRSTSVLEGLKGGISPVLYTECPELWLAVRDIAAGEPITFADIVQQ